MSAYQSSVPAVNEVEIILNLHQQDAFALENAPGIGAEPVIAQNSNVLQAEKIFIRPWWSEYYIRKQLPGIAVRIIDASEGWNDCTPPPARADAQQEVLFIVAPPLGITAIDCVSIRAEDSIVVPLQIGSESSAACQPRDCHAIGVKRQQRVQRT